MILRFCLLVSTVSAFVAPRPAIVTPVKTLLQATAIDATAVLDASQTSSVNAIAAAITDLASKPEFVWQNEMVAGCSATLDARDAPGPSNIAWMAALNVQSKANSLTIFNGPLTNVPHLVSRCVVVNDNTLQFVLDFRPRAYGAYEMRRPDGSYPGPEELGRQSFEYSGNRMEYDSTFGTEEVKEFLAATLASFECATPHDPNPTELDLLTRGPLYTSVSMPLTDGNVAAIARARETAVNFWVSWATSSHEHRPGAPINAQYVYDTKYKQNAYGALLNEYSTLFGPADGQKLAVGESGPLDEAYVGGGS